MNYARLSTRIITGLMFLIVGLNKLVDVQGTAEFLGSLGIPAASVMTWALILVEVVGGAMILAGFKPLYAAVPLMAVMVVATVLTQLGIPGAPSKVLGSLTSSGPWLHVLVIAVLYDFASNGAGELSIEA